MDDQDVIRICREVDLFSRIAKFRFKALPVVAWEFADLRDFMNARVALMRAIEPQMLMMTRGRDLLRKVDDSTVEIDCHGVTFRLTCHQRIMTKHGPRGAAHL
jgi:hypothetical protein